MATFPTPRPEDEAHLYPPYTGITFTYVFVDPKTKKPVLQTETMIEQTSSAKYPVKLFEVQIGATMIHLSPQQIRFVVKSWLSVFVALAENIEQRRSGGSNPPPRGGNIEKV